MFRDFRLQCGSEISCGGIGSKSSALLSNLDSLLGYSSGPIVSHFIGCSQNCDQDLVNIIVSLWWSVTLICSISVVRLIPFRDLTPGDGERLLVDDHTSPVGYKVPSLPDFEVDPDLSNEGNPLFSINMEFTFGIVLAILVGFVMVAFTLSDWEHILTDNFDGAVGALKEDF
jgi:hypothetical protein